MTRSYPVPANEAERLTALQATGILGTSPEPEFDGIVTLACEAFGVPISLVALLDAHEQWFKAARGVDLCTNRRERAFCNYVVASGEPLIVEDTWLDPRFARHPHVIGSPQVRFYVGVPLALSAGINLGTLCLLDTRPRLFPADHLRQLRLMAEIVTALIRQHRDARIVADLATDMRQQNRIIRRQAEALASSKAMFDRASVLTKMGAWEWSLPDDRLTWTDGMYDLHDISRGTPVTWDQVRRFYVKSARRELERLYRRSDTDCAGFTFEGQVVTTKGNKRWVRLTVDVEVEGGSVVRRFGVKQDITEQKILWDQMQRLAECDPLTGLANWARLQDSLLDLPAPGAVGQATLLLVDLDQFKTVNDTFGHVVGDECLKQLAGRLKRLSRRAAVVARLGGDEFAVLFRSAQSNAEIEAFAGAILAVLKRPVRRHGQSFQLSGSIGIATDDAPQSQLSDIFARADLALYAAKSAGRNTFRLFEPQMKTAADLRFETVANISRALNRNELEMFYQPKVDLLNEDVAGFEALLRWRRADGTIVPAGDFADALADPELSARIGDWLIVTVLDQAAAWVSAGLRFGHIAVNVTSGQVNDIKFAERLIQQIADRGLSPRVIEVEVTEGVLLDTNVVEVSASLRILREAGIRIALDDFGTGYASLVHLRAYPVDVIKIDKSFVKQFLTSVADHAIVQATLFLARHLELDVVAEGIEELDQRDFLKALGCRFGQGFFFSQALDATHARDWCRPVPREDRLVDA